MMNLKKYLIELASVGATPQQIAEAKIQYRKEYLRRKKKQYRKESKQIKLSLKPEQFLAWKKISAKRNQFLAVFIKQAVEDYLETIPMLPSFDVFAKADQQLIGACSNLNRLTKIANAIGYVQPEHLRVLRDEVIAMNKAVTQLNQKPENLMDYLPKYFKDYPEFVCAIPSLIENLTSIYNEHELLQTVQSSRDQATSALRRAG